MMSDRQSIISDYKFTNNLEKPIQKTNKEKKKDKKRKIQQLHKQQPQENGFYFNIQVIRKVATFLQNIKSSIVREVQQLQPLQSFYLQNQQTSIYSSKNLISWQNPILLGFEFLLLVFIGVIMWMNSYQLVFGTIKSNLTFNFIFMGLYLFYILISLNTEQKNQKLQIIDSRKLILKSYIKNQLSYDIIIMIGSILQISGVGWGFYPSHIMTMSIIKVFVLLMNKFQNKFAVSIQVESIISIFKLLFKIIIFIHFLSLVFNAMSKLQKQNGVDYTWVEKNNFNSNNDFERYVYAWYWASTIISTVGFGDITPANVYQCAFISFVELLCSVMLGYSVNYIGTMVGVLGQSKETYEKDIRRLNKYLKTLTIPSNLQNSIRSHFYNKYQIDQVYDPESEQYLFMKLTQKLKTDVKETNNLSIIKKSKMFEVFSEEALHNLARVMRKAVYAPSELLFDQNSQVVKLFIIQEGFVNELPLNNKFTPKSKPIFNYSNQDENTIGWMNLVTGNKYQSCTKAQTYTITYQITREEFIRVLKKHHKDYHLFHQLKQRAIQKPTKFIKKCLVCDRLTHNAVQCPRIHFIPKKLQVLVRNNQYEKQKNIGNPNYKRNNLYKQIQIPRQLDFVDQNAQDTTRNQTNKALHQTQFKKYLSSLEKSINKNIIDKEAIKRLSFQKKLEKHNFQEQQKPRKDTDIFNRSTANINPKYTVKEIEEGVNNLNIHGNFQTIEMKHFMLHRFDKVLLDELKQFFPSFNVKNVYYKQELKNSYIQNFTLQNKFKTFDQR